MKKRILLVSVVLLLVLFSFGALAAGGTSDDPLISLSYLQKTFLPSISDSVDDKLSGLDTAYRDASSSLAAKADQYLAQASGETNSDLLYSAAFSDTSFRRSDAVTLPTGSGFLLRAGSAEVTHDGTVIDVTSGSALSSGAKLTENHRYLVGEDTSAQFRILSEAAVGAVEGTYSFSPSTLSFTMPFTDVAEGNWFHDAVTFAYQKGLFSGTSQTTFSPNGNITRGMVVTVLYQMAGRPEADTHNRFTDVPATAYYAAPVTWATTLGVSSGISSDLFAPNNNITREQLACMLYSYARTAGMDVSARNNLSQYTDRESISLYAVEALSWAVGSGIISGIDTNTLSPKGTATRAQMAAMLRVFSSLT